MKFVGHGLPNVPRIVRPLYVDLSAITSLPSVDYSNCLPKHLPSTSKKYHSQHDTVYSTCSSFNTPVTAFTIMGFDSDTDAPQISSYLAENRRDDQKDAAIEARIIVFLLLLFIVEG